MCDAELNIVLQEIEKISRHTDEIVEKLRRSKRDRHPEIKEPETHLVIITDDLHAHG